jgi:hypothetical protein
VDEVLSRQGFVRVLPEEHPFLEQLNLVRQARFIVAPGGLERPAELLCPPGNPPLHPDLALHPPPAGHGRCRPRTRVGSELSDRAVRHRRLPLAEHPFWRFWSDYRIDPALLARFLAAWPAGPDA